MSKFHVGSIVKIQSRKYSNVVTLARVLKILEDDKVQVINSISSLKGMSRNLDDWGLTVDKVSKKRVLFHDDTYPIKELIMNIEDVIEEQDFFDIYYEFFKPERSGIDIKF